MRLETWEKFEEAEEGTQFYGNDGEKYIKVEQNSYYHLEGCVVRLDDGKVLHWSRVK